MCVWKLLSAQCHSVQALQMLNYLVLFLKIAKLGKLHLGIDTDDD